MDTVFDLINTHTLISEQSESNFIVFRLQPHCTFCLFLYKGICCGYPFELHRLVDAIQMSSYNICFYKENQKKSRKHHQISPLLILFLKCTLSRQIHIFYLKFSQ